MPTPIFETGGGPAQPLLRVYDAGNDELCIQIGGERGKETTIRWGDVETLRNDLDCWLNNPC